MAEKYVVRLAVEGRDELTALVSGGRSSAVKIRHAQVLLKADADGPNWAAPWIADALPMYLSTVAGIRKQWVERGMDAALNRKPQAWPSCTPKLDGEGKARVGG